MSQCPNSAQSSAGEAPRGVLLSHTKAAFRYCFANYAKPGDPGPERVPPLLCPIKGKLLQYTKSKLISVWEVSRQQGNVAGFVADFLGRCRL